MSRALAAADHPPTPRRPRVRRVSTAWLSPQQAAAHLGVSVTAIYEACASKGLRHAKLGHSTIRIRPAWLDAWVEDRAS